MGLSRPVGYFAMLCLYLRLLALGQPEPFQGSQLNQQPRDTDQKEPNGEVTQHTEYVKLEPVVRILTSPPAHESVRPPCLPVCSKGILVSRARPVLNDTQKGD